MTPEEDFIKQNGNPCACGCYKCSDHLVEFTRKALEEGHRQGAEEQREKDASNRMLCPLCQKNLEERPPL